MRIYACTDSVKEKLKPKEYTYTQLLDPTTPEGVYRSPQRLGAVIVIHSNDYQSQNLLLYKARETVRGMAVAAGVFIRDETASVVLDII